MLTATYNIRLSHALVANQTNGVKLTCNDFGITTAPNTEHNIFLSAGSVFNIQDHAVYAQQNPGPNQSINTHNRFADPVTWTTTDAHKFNISGWMLNYDYYYGDNNDQTQIHPHPYDGISPNPLVNNISTPLYTHSYSRCGSEINGGKFVMFELFQIDNMKDTLTNKQNYYNSIVDNGNTQYYLNYIENLQPNNFNNLYNQLISNTPYISDTVLMAFMVHPINKPAHKKNLVTACSPLPFKVRPYINEMNVNQNFKNQLWALQSGNNYRVVLENEIANRDFGINGKFGDLVISTLLVDTIPEKTDTLLNYVLQNGSFPERIITSPVFIEQERYNDAQNNLNEIANQTFGDMKMQDFIDLQNLQMQLNQTEDSLWDSILLQSEIWLWNIAADSTHFCQSDAVSLLETLHDTILPRYVYLENSITTKHLSIQSIIEKADECMFTLHPNPANNTLNIIFNETENIIPAYIHIYDMRGTLVKTLTAPAENKALQLNVSKWIRGKYFIILQDYIGKKCVKSFVVN